MRERSESGWEIFVYRPYETWEDLIEGIKRLRPDWRRRPNLVAAIDEMEAPVVRKIRLIDLQNRSKHAVDQTGFVEYLPDLKDDDLVANLLDVPFHDVKFSNWRNVAGQRVFAASTKADFHIVPKNYAASMIEINAKSCMRCHTDTGLAVRLFDQSLARRGRVRGSHGIFSWHPFSIRSISRQGIVRRWEFRPAFVRAGILAEYNPTIHPAPIYQSIAGTN